MSNSTQPNFIVPTPTAGDSSNRAASTQFVATAIANAIGSAAITASLATKAGTTQADFLAGGIRTPTNQSYRLIERVPYTLTFTQFVAQEGFTVAHTNFSTAQSGLALTCTFSTTAGSSGCFVAFSPP